MNKTNKKLDVLLAITPRILDDFGYTPAGPASIKGMLSQHGYTSKIIDFNYRLDEMEWESQSIKKAVDNFFLYYNFYNKRTWEVISPIIIEWCQEIIDEDPEWVGISVFSYNSQRASRLMAIKLKEMKPDIKIMLGGAGLASDKVFAESLYEAKIIDAYVKAEGELAIIEVLKGNYDYPGVNGQEPQQIMDIEGLAYPNYDDYELQTYTNAKGLIALPITGSRGCVRNCTFCDVHGMWPKFRFRSGKHVADEIKHQVTKYGVRCFRFTDSLINGSMTAFRDFIEQLAAFRDTLPEEQKFTWDTHYLIRSIRLMKPEDFDLMARAGAGTMHIGVESGSERIRDHMRKGYSQADLDYNLEHFSRVGIKTRFLMIVGYPTETIEDFQATMDMFTRYKPYCDDGTIEELNLGVTLNLLPNTPLNEERDKYQIEKFNNHINDWICLTNPSLDYKERLRRRITLQSHVEGMGYRVFEARNYTKQLFTSYTEVKNNKFKEQVLLDSNFKFDREQGGLVSGNTPSI